MKPLLLGLKACPCCGSWFARASLLCRFCERLLKNQANRWCEERVGLRSHFLFQWNPGESDRLSALLLALKGSARREAWDVWTHVFLQKHRLSLREKRKPVLIAAPAARSTKVDHSWLFAEALSRQAGWDFLGRPFLHTDLRKQQKERGRLERRDVPLEKNTGFAAPSKADWLLVDDVITTGATARAVYEALGSPSSFEILSLAARETVILRRV